MSRISIEWSFGSLPQLTLQGINMNNFFTAISLALALVAELGTAEAAIKAGQPAVLGDPASGGPIKTYLFGKHVGIGPVPINPV
jgi:hypothetical protein